MTNGQNLIQIQIGYWSLIPLDTQEPYLLGAWDYLIKGVQWAQQFGLKVMIDLHGGTSTSLQYTARGLPQSRV